MKLRSVWTGDPPEFGDVLRSGIRPRYAYVILAVDRADDRPYGKVNRFTLTVERIAASDVPPNATIHTWKWDKRNRRSA